MFRHSTILISESDQIIFTSLLKCETLSHLLCSNIVKMNYNCVLSLKF